MTMWEDDAEEAVVMAFPRLEGLRIVQAIQRARFALVGSAARETDEDERHADYVAKNRLIAWELDILDALGEADK